MALLTFNPPVAPSLQSEREITFKVFEAGFGNGYEQRSLDGTNPVRHTWNLVWESLSTTEANTIEAFFIATNCTEPFYWQSPLDAGSAGIEKNHANRAKNPAASARIAATRAGSILRSVFSGMAMRGLPAKLSACRAIKSQ